jgi:hypothetical protein
VAKNAFTISSSIISVDKVGLGKAVHFSVTQVHWGPGKNQPALWESEATNYFDFPHEVI